MRRSSKTISPIPLKGRNSTDSARSSKCVKCKISPDLLWDNLASSR
jgi:hypothetical protein